MTCNRCHGLMVMEQICDYYDETGADLCFVGYRCLQCGEIVDAVILENRRQATDSSNSTRRKEPRLPLLVSM